VSGALRRNRVDPDWDKARLASIYRQPDRHFSERSVTLGCDGGGYPGGANDVPTCSSIPPVTISGTAPTTTTLSIQTQPGTTPAQYSEFVNAVDSSGVAMANTTVAVTVIAPAQSFALTNTPVSIATPGASGTSTITISPAGGFSAPVALSCIVTGPATAVDLPTCSVAAPPAITSITAVSATLTVNTTAASSSSNATGQAATAFRKQRNRLLALGGGNALAAFLFFLDCPYAVAEQRLCLVCCCSVRSLQ
jgi:hypothetical protein